MVANFECLFGLIQPTWIGQPTFNEPVLMQPTLLSKIRHKNFTSYHY